jgi:hypothetical protein
MNSVDKVREVVVSDLDSFVRWPKTALLLWMGCARDRYHNYPQEIDSLLSDCRIYRRNWSNDPAIHAFLLAGGDRPKRLHRGFGWNVHHLYFGVAGQKRGGTHAVKDGFHFTQSAGLVAVHPIADALCEEDQDFSHALRKISFDRFGYDPDGMFSSQPRDEFGFIAPHSTKVIYRNQNFRVSS